MARALFHTAGSLVIDSWRFQLSASRARCAGFLRPAYPGWKSQDFAIRRPFDGVERLGEERGRKLAGGESWLDPHVRAVMQWSEQRAPRWRCISLPR